MLLLDDALHEIRLHRQEVNLVCHTFRGLHSGNVWIDEHSFYAFFAQCLQCLRTRIVEFAGLTYLQCSRTEEQNFLYRFVFHAGLLKEINKLVEKELCVHRT